MVEKTRYRLQPHLATDPEATLKAMEVVQESLSKAHGDATSGQQVATEQRWISGIAHESNSHMTSQAPDGEVVHRTGMRVARRGADRDGILTLKVVAHDEDVGRAGALEVRGASLEGVPQPMADHLKTHALADLQFPSCSK